MAAQRLWITAPVCAHYTTPWFMKVDNTIERVENDDQRLIEQFMQQQHNHDIDMFDFEKELHDNKASFSKVRKLLPTRYRFRVVDAQGNDIRDHSSASFSEGTTQSTYQSSEYTRVH